ncbi:MAG: PAAR domain-containing protein [Pseudomonas sp.]|nr:PAAR domain-containing protein [Pseudomonas sp.]
MVQAREGDQVSCGKDGKTYQIIGGIAHININGRRVAGTLDSFSGCPCEAQLIPSVLSATYRFAARLRERLDDSNGSRFSRPRPLQPRPHPAAAHHDPSLEEEEEEEELQAHGIVLRLGLFFDGTGNNQGNSATGEGCRARDVGLDGEATAAIRQRCAAFGYEASGVVPANSYGSETSNVARLHDLYPDHSSKTLASDANEAHIKVYIEGIGTTSGQGDSLYSQGTGRGSTGVVARVEQAPASVLQQLRQLQEYNPKLKINRIEVDLFGFSRGAAAARHCANDLLKGPKSLLAEPCPSGHLALPKLSLGTLAATLSSTSSACSTPWRASSIP